MVRIDRVTGETMSIRPQAAAGRAGAPLELGHAARACRRTIRRSSTPRRNKVFRSAEPRPDVDGDQPGSHDQRESRRDRHDGREGQRHHASRRTTASSAWPTIVSLAESPKRAGHALRRHRRRQRAGVARRRQDVDERHRRRSRACRRASGCREVVPSRFDEGTVYVTFDDHRQNDFETYIYVEQRLRPDVAVARRQPEGRSRSRRSPRIRRIRTCSTSAPRPGCSCRSIAAKSWSASKANLPTVRIDEITLHPRDNAMILATHGRAIWILDHLEPIQEYAAAQAATTDAKLFTPPPYGDVPPPGARSQLRVLGRPDVLRREPAAGGGASRGSTRSRSAT